MRTFKRFLRQEAGTTVIEYALIATLISIAALTAMVALGTRVSLLYTTILAGVMR